MLTVLENLLAIDEDMNHPGRKLVWLFERSMILYGSRVEDREVGEIAGCDQSTFLDFQVACREGSEFANRLFERGMTVLVP